ncbi:PREDICTED: kinesin-like protein KIF14 [Priapulus caudatus]|uniref:Kinesin-like protein KIF14 n=1 Tax=Priapulus caudatus TaxID=37621 RepID=A0ABM1EDK0_PRICU|nr:PREDICTED: kinesin-like protein KIF14 [Priapulus caudatus]
MSSSKDHHHVKNSRAHDLGRHVIRKPRSQPTTPVKQGKDSVADLLQLEIHSAAGQLLISPEKSRDGSRTPSRGRSQSAERPKKTLKFKEVIRKNDENLKSSTKMPEQKDNSSTPRDKVRPRSSPHPNTTTLSCSDNTASPRLSTPAKYFRSPIIPKDKTPKKRQGLSPKGNKLQTPRAGDRDTDSRTPRKSPINLQSILKTPKKTAPAGDEGTPDTAYFSKPTSVQRGKFAATTCNTNGLTPTTTSQPCSLDNFDDEEGSSVTVGVRVRPFTSRELLEENLRSVVQMSGNKCVVTTDAGATHDFHYDACFWSFAARDDHFAGQYTVYNTIAQPLLARALEGYNVCLFAYGQTSSGKSYSIMGEPNAPGIIPRFCEDLFAEAVPGGAVVYNIEISYYEIYNEKIHDLLQASNEKGQKTSLKVREHPVMGPYVEDLTKVPTQSYSDVLGWLELGNKQRATAATGMNDKSSRSHSVFTLVLTQTRTDSIDDILHESSKTSRINLVDLAGSERAANAKTTGDRFKEGVNINKSLMMLGKVILQLAERSRKKTFIQYRDSVLTWARVGVAVKVDSKTPYLVNLNEDAQLSETLLYLLKSGVTTVGRMQEGTTRDIQLMGALIATNHCTIRNEDQAVTVYPCAEAPTYVNGAAISTATQLQHGDRLVLGGDHYFRLNNPAAAQKRSVGGKSRNKDFTYAYDELVQRQKAEVEAEIREAEVKVRQEALVEIEKAKQDVAHEMSMQKHDYEAQLQDLQEVLDVQKEEHREEKKQWHHTQKEVDKIEQEKWLLEAEIAKKGLELDLISMKKDSQQHESESWAVLEALQKEANLATQGLTGMQSPTRTATKKRLSCAQLYRQAMMMREANTIAKTLGKQMEFVRESAAGEGATRADIRVHNRKLGVSTVWSIEQFDTRLQQMRELFQTSSKTGEEEVFYNPKDKWYKDGHTTPLRSPNVLQALQKTRLSASFCMSPLTSHSSAASCTSVGRRASVKLSDSSCWSSNASMLAGGAAGAGVEAVLTPTLSACRHLITDSIDRLQTNADEEQEESQADKMLATCQQLETALTALTKEASCDDTSKTKGSYQSWWRTQARWCGSGIVDVCRHAGELACALQTAAVCLGECTTGMEVSAALKQAFVSGGALHVDRTLQSSLTAVEDYHTQTQAILNGDRSQRYLESAQHLQAVLASMMTLLSKLRMFQAKTDSSLSSSLSSTSDQSSGLLADQLSHRFDHCKTVVAELTQVTSGLLLLTHGIVDANKGQRDDLTEIRRIARSVKRTVCKLASVLGVTLEGTTDDADDCAGGDCSCKLFAGCRSDEVEDLLQDVQHAVQMLTDLLEWQIGYSHLNLALVSPCTQRHAQVPESPEVSRFVSLMRPSRQRHGRAGGRLSLVQMVLEDTRQTVQKSTRSPRTGRLAQSK